MTKAILHSAVSIGVLIFTTSAYAQALPEAESVSGDDIVVTGTIVSGEMKSIAAQRKADNIVNVLTSDGIGRLPDRNAAEAVQRLPTRATEALSA